MATKKKAAAKKAALKKTAAPGGAGRKAGAGISRSGGRAYRSARRSGMTVREGPVAPVAAAAVKGRSAGRGEVLVNALRDVVHESIGDIETNVLIVMEKQDALEKQVVTLENNMNAQFAEVHKAIAEQGKTIADLTRLVASLANTVAEQGKDIKSIKKILGKK